MKLTPKLFKQSGFGLAALAMLVVPAASYAADSNTNTVIKATIGSTITVSSASTAALNLTPGSSPVLSTASDIVSVRQLK